LLKDCIKQKDVQETARDQNNFGLRVEQPPLSDVVNKAIDFQYAMLVKIVDTIPVGLYVFCSGTGI